MKPEDIDGWEGLSAIGRWAELAAEERQRLEGEINSLFAQTFTTPAGAQVLKYLRAVTIEQPTWWEGQSDHREQSIREGQNYLVRDIERRVARGRGQEV